MKSVKEVVNHLKKQSFYKFIIQKSEFYKIISQKQKFHILFVYTKNEGDYFDKNKKQSILMVALRHPGSKKEMSLSSNLSDLKTYVKIMNLKYKEESYFKDVKEIRFFIPTKLIKLKNRNELVQAPKIEYKERSNGTFKNNFKDKELFKIFEEIREVINASR